MDMEPWLTGIAGLTAGSALTFLFHGWKKRKTASLPEGEAWVQRVRFELEGVKKESRHYSSLFNLLPFPIWRRGKDLKVTYCNLAYTSMLEEVPDWLLEEYGMELSEAGRDLAARALDVGAEVCLARHMVIHGERRLFNFYERPDKDNDGTIGFAIDVTQREEVEEELRRQITAHSQLLESSNLATAIFGADRRIRFYNSAYANLWKLDKEWLDTQPVFDEIFYYLREKRRMPEVANYQQYLASRNRLFTDILEPYSDIMYLPDGRILRLVAVPHTLGGVIFSFEDVTDRFVLERSYNTLIAVQRQTLNHLQEGIAVYGEDLRLKLCNPVYTKLWQFPADIVNGEPHINDVLERCKHQLKYTNWDEFKDHTVQIVQGRKMSYQRLEKVDGTVVDLSSVPLPDGGALFTFLDVTDSTLVERSLIEKNEALREADRLKTQFLLSVSYELRSPLTSIRGFTEFLQAGFAGELGERQREYMLAIQESASHLDYIINNILELASIQAGLMRLAVKPVAVEELLESVFEPFAERMARMELTHEIKCEKGLGTIEVDRSRIRQVLISLICNAVKFNRKGGHILLEVSHLPENEIRFLVEDTGSGITEADMPYIFEQFHAGMERAHHAGAGLGLALAKHVVELHGGTISIYSKEGEGTSVSVILPVRHVNTMVERGNSARKTPLAMMQQAHERKKAHKKPQRKRS